MAERDTPIVAFVGGSGITPVYSNAKAALATTERPIQLVYANRDLRSIIFSDALALLAESSGGRLAVHHHIDGVSGFLSAAECATVVGDRADADFYVCGPGPFMDTVEAGLSPPFSCEGGSLRDLHGPDRERLDHDEGQQRPVTGGGG